MRRFILILLLTVSLGLPALAQEGPTPLRPESPVRDTLDNANPRRTYTFPGEQGLTIYLTLLSRDFDNELRLIDPNGTVVAEEQGNALGISLIGPFILPADGQYTVVATRPEWEERGGEYLLLAGPADPVELAPGEPLRGRLESAGAAVFFTLMGDADDVIGYRTRGLDLGVIINTPTGDRLLSDGHYESPRRPLIILPQSGRYTGIVQTISPGGTEFALAFQPVNPEPLEPSAPANGAINEMRPSIFTFESAAGKLWQIGAAFEPPEGQAWLEIHRPDSPDYFGEPLAADCCRGPNGMPRIAPFIAPADGIYYVVLSYDDFDEDTERTVDYEVALASSTLVSLAPGSPVSDTVTPETGAISYAYEGRQGEVLTVRIERLAGESNPGLRILSPEDEVVVFEGRAAHAATFEIELPLDGMYLFEVYGVSYEPATLEFSLQLDSEGR